MINVLLSAFACDPFKGSEASNGFNWATGLASMGYEVTCLTRKVHKSSIEKAAIPANLKFVYVDLSGLEKLYSASQASMYLYYLLWQKKAQKIAASLHKKKPFQLAHHVTWGSIQMGSFLYKLDIPFIFGPAGGGQVAPEKFQQYFQEFWSSETKRSRVSSFLQSFNPAYKKMLQRSTYVLVANEDTRQLVTNHKSSGIYKTFDFALPAAFFPERIQEHKSIYTAFNMLWVGRFMPRKGLMLVMDVMLKLKSHKNISLTIVGDGEMAERLNDFIMVNQLENIHLTGKVSHEQVKELYESHDAFFFTSLRDSCPVQLLEAMAFGLPVITLDLHGQAEIVNEETGIKVLANEPVETVNLLASSILELSKDEERFNRMRHAAFDFARNHTWDKKIRELTDKFYPKQ
ncbi:MAG: glycosyltransferase family 4 protein [Flavitalea sp.]